MKLKTTVNPTRLSHFGVLATAFCYGLVLLLFSYWNITRPNGINWVIWTAQSLPLLMLLPGLVQKYHRSYSWLCFLIMIYFVKAVDGAFAPSANWSDYLFVILTVSTFITAMLTSRWLQRT